MKIRSVLHVCIILAFCTGCGQKADEMKQAYDNMKNLSNAAQNVDKNQAKMNARQEERRKRGDTLAIPYQELQKYLPSSVSGYTSAEPEGQSINMPGASYSVATRRYTKTEGGEMEISVTDYNANAAMYTGLVALWGAGFSMEDSHGYARSYNTGTEDVAAWEQYNKDNKEANITYAAGGRFIVAVKGTQQSNTDAVKDIGKSMNLKELASK